MIQTFDTKRIFEVENLTFSQLCLDVFHFQNQGNRIYSDFIQALGIDIDKIDAVEKIPFMPIQFFKNHEVKVGDFHHEAVFTSSGTTNVNTSHHYVKDLNLYEESFFRCFEQYYGAVEDYVVLGLLPAYLERSGSSLIYMVQKMIERTNNPQSGFYLYEYEALAKLLQQLDQEQRKVLLIGVTFALIDFANAYHLSLKNTIIMETGGMKGRGKELTRDELHRLLHEKLGVSTVHSEYGMTELLSQAYSKGKGIYHTPPWMRVLLRKEDDPFCILNSGKGLLNVIDLANIYSCSFIATDDIAKLHPDGSFEILGRIDSSDIRGCSLLTV